MKWHAPLTRAGAHFTCECGTRAFVSAGIIRAGKIEATITGLDSIARLTTSPGNITRALRAGIGGLVGSIAGPVGILGGAALGAATASGKQTHRIRISRAGAPPLIATLTPEQCAGIEMASGHKIR